MDLGEVDIQNAGSRNDDGHGIDGDAPGHDGHGAGGHGAGHDGRAPTPRHDGTPHASRRCALTSLTSFQGRALSQTAVLASLAQHLPDS